MANDTKPLRCAIYTRKSTEHGLEQEFNSLDAQREACEAYIKSQAHEGWRPTRSGRWTTRACCASRRTGRPRPSGIWPASRSPA